MGQNHTEEFKKKLSLSLIGNKRGAGHKVSAEHRKKLIAGKLAYYKKKKQLFQSM